MGVQVGIALLLLTIGTVYAGRRAVAGQAPSGSPPTTSSVPQHSLALAPLDGSNGLDRNKFTLENPEKRTFVPVYPRDGAKKVFENDKIIVWDELTINTKEYEHIHIRNTIAVYVDGGVVIHRMMGGTNPATAPQTADGRLDAYRGQDRVPHISLYTRGPHGPHSSISGDPSKPRRIFFIEFKGTEPWNCKDYSTDPICNGASPESVAERVGRTIGADRNTFTKSSASKKKFAPAFPNPAALKVFENEKLVVWDEILTSVQLPMRLYVRDTIGVFINDGPVKITDADGKQVTTLAVQAPHVSSFIRAPYGPLTEAAADASHPRRVFWLELKGSEPWDCKDYSTDPACQ
jgi:hypothetical protein